MKFSLPYIDQPLSFWKKLRESYIDHIEEVYFPIRRNFLPSGRPIQSHTHIYSFLKNIELPKTVLVNPIVFPHPIEQLEDIIINELKLLNKHYGVCKVTVSNLLLCKSIKKNLEEFEVSASVLMRINYPEQIPYLENYVDGITLDTAIVRDLKKIRHIRENFSGFIKLIPNEGCLPGCPFRTQHFYEMSCDLPYPESLCHELLDKLPWLRLKSAWILPQHLHFYDGLFDIIKLAGRVTLQNPQKYLRVFRAYLQRTPIPVNEIGCGPAGMTENIPISDDIFYKTITCYKKCSQCNICQQYYEKYA